MIIAFFFSMIFNELVYFHQEKLPKSLRQEPFTSLSYQVAYLTSPQSIPADFSELSLKIRSVLLKYLIYALRCPVLRHSKQKKNNFQVICLHTLGASAQALQCLESCCLTSAGDFRAPKPTASEISQQQVSSVYVHTGSTLTCWTPQDTRSSTIQKRFKKRIISIYFSGIQVLVSLMIQVSPVSLKLRNDTLVDWWKNKQTKTTNKQKTTLRKENFLGSLIS